MPLRLQRRPPFIARAAGYRFPAQLRRALVPALIADTEISVDTAQHGEQAPPGELYELWKNTPGGHKWLHYFPLYEEILAGLRNRPIRMLEIGIYNGASLQLWRRYLHPESVIVGIDIDKRCAQFERAADLLYCRIGDQSDATFLKSVVSEFGAFDLVLDDGSHMVSHMIASFNHLFADGLVDGGTYIAEDTHSNFWPRYRDRRYSFVDLAKDLVDAMHAHYIDQRSEAHFRRGHPQRRVSATVPKISTQIEEVRFRDSIVIVRKRARAYLPTSVHV